jgi:hypothetical protein
MVASMKVTREAVTAASRKAQAAENMVKALEARLDALEEAPKSTFWGRIRWLFLGR